MKRLLAAVALTAAWVTPGLAADMPVKAPVYKAASVDWWTGGYIGVNIGYSFGDWDASSNQLVFETRSLTASPQVDGVIGGAQIGYNFRTGGSWLVGVEADIQISGERRSLNWIDPGLPFDEGPITDFVPRCCGPASLSHEWKFLWFGTLRGRVGVTPSDWWLFYVTGGLAYGETRYSFAFSQPGSAIIAAPTSYALSQSDFRVGYTVGVGTELKFDRNWSVKFEYLYIDLGTVEIRTLDIDGLPFRVDYRARDHILRIGVNYRFDNWVSARY